ncbi:MAG: hypothetical protein Q8O13_05560 [Candidatus Omnitrophota bacterium]|nr:hypothetical protein [Candidatus Omnitrophota bacterium]
MRKSIFFIISLIFLTDICDTISQLFLKSAINHLGLRINSVSKVFRFIVQLIRIPRVWIGFLLSIFSLGFWLFVLSKADLNFAFSLDSMRYVLIALASTFILKEKIGIVRWLGIACVVFGIMLVAAG